MDTKDRMEITLTVKVYTEATGGRGMGSRDQGTAQVFTLRGDPLELARKAVLQGVKGASDRTEPKADQRIADHVLKSPTLPKAVHALLAELVREGYAEAKRKADAFVENAPTVTGTVTTDPVEEPVEEVRVVVQ